MIKAIVYESNAGHTKHYAELLSGETGLQACELKNAGKVLSKGDEVIFMGWLMAGSVKGFGKAAGKYAVKAVCTVGMANPSEKFAEETVNRYKIKDAKVFYLKGGYDINKLHGIYRIMMNTMAKNVTASIEKKAEKTPEDLASLDLFKNGGDYVCKENLADVVKWYNSVKS
ncbi:MAG TPA: hypothetical protein VHT96_15325 [Clostridia bacterium]|nr:hypothetical protein [Clostridia bacterium]